MQWLKFYLQLGNKCKFDIHDYTRQLFQSTLLHVIVKFTTQVSAYFKIIDNRKFTKLMDSKFDFMMTLLYQEFKMITSLR